MKNIIIAGIPRSGKTTLAKNLLHNFKEYGYIEEDVLDIAAQRTYNKYLAKKEGDTTKIDIQEAREYKETLLKSLISIINGEKVTPYIIDSETTDIKYLRELQDDGIIVVFLGYPNLTEEELFENIRMYDTPKDRTYYLSDCRLRFETDAYPELSIEAKKECKKQGINFFDTSINREEVLKDVYNYIKSELKK